jgi:hypothetical protein
MNFKIEAAFKREPKMILALAILCCCGSNAARADSRLT